MRRIGVAELKDHLSEHLRAVERGAEVEVTDRDRPIARITPIPTPEHGPRLVRPMRDFRDVRDRTRPSAGWAVESTALLLEERGER